MTPFPLALTAILGKPLAYLIFLLIGFGFGYVLESSGFAHSPKLAAQFYFKDMTVLKVMFTGIIVAMVLIFGSTAFGWLDYRLIWVNPTYLWPGIVGGLIMGVGFIVGGFCPGTSLVAMATGKIDGMFMEPTVVVDVDHTMKIMNEETFGPVLPIMKVADETHAIQLANDSDFGLGSGVFTQNVARAHRVSARIRVSLCGRRTELGRSEGARSGLTRWRGSAFSWKTPMNELSIFAAARI